MDEQSIIPNSSSSPPPSLIDTTLTIPKKPQRPLTAYHIFLQIEREYIIQTIDGDVADDKSMMMENKILHDDVPQRYKNIKLMPDWYAGPSKCTKKRKHRKQHGKIGFLELSKTISKRWSQLDQVDPETKSFVQKIAKSEVAEYYKEMNEYKELIKDLPPSALPPKAKKKKTKNKKRTAMEQKQQVSGGSDTTSLLELEQQGCSKKMKTFHLQEEEESSTPLSTSTDSESTTVPTKKMKKNSKKNFVRRVTMTIDNTDSITEAFDSFKNDQPLDFDDLFCQPIGNSQPIGVEVMMGMDMMNEDPGLQHSISSGSLSTMSRSYPNEGRNSPLAEVDLCDDEILKLWESSISDDEEEELDMDSVLIDLCI